MAWLHTLVAARKHFVADLAARVLGLVAIHVWDYFFPAIAKFCDNL